VASTTKKTEKGENVHTKKKATYTIYREQTIVINISRAFNSRIIKKPNACNKQGITIPSRNLSKDQKEARVSSNTKNPSA